MVTCCQTVSGIVCNKCHHTLRCHTMDEHLDINHPVHQCPSHDEVLLIENQKRRENALDKYREFIDGMIEDVNGKRPKNIRYRKWLRNRLRYGAMTVFKTEEEEYQFIGKYGRGIWCNIETAFKKEEQNIMTEFAFEYGAFDY